ncbi:WD40 repeat-like protein [Hypoxylon fuscum]|nr:WD40 repeat-like protein [Hypoxylon fuscum]
MQPATLGHLSREYVLNPITALAFYKSSNDGQQYLLAGEDTDIKIYHVQTSRVCGQLSVFRAQSIQGIAVPPGDVAQQQQRQILVWGGHSVKVLSGDTIEGLISGQNDNQSLPKGATAETRAPDWVFDGRISPFGDGRIVLLTAHNEVIQAHVDPARGSLVFGGVQSPSRPILYSGNFFWVSKDCVLVAAGTVFGEILFWRCHLGAEKQDPSCEVLFVFTGHEGSIFGVHISPEIYTSTGETLRLLASCSDDRTIRVWDITERREKPEHLGQGYENGISNARETGFGNNSEATEHDDSSTRCVATAMGHASRIWEVEFPQDQLLCQTSNIVEIYSFGEDATAQKWNLSLDPRPVTSDAPDAPSTKPAAELTHQSTFSNHSGKHIWSHALASNPNDGLIIATGGADGKVALIGAGTSHLALRKSSGNGLLPTNNTTDGRKAVPWSLADVVQSFQTTTAPQDTSGSQATPSLNTKPKNAKEAFNRYTFVSDRRLLAATNSGRVFVGTFEDELTWKELILPDEIGQIVFSHALLGTLEANPMALVGTTNGDIYNYDKSGGESLQLLTKVEGKVAQILYLSGTSKVPVTEGDKFVQNGNTTISDGNLRFLVTILRSDKAIIIQVNPSTLTTKHIEVALDPGFMVTAAAFVHGHLLIGSRKGFIAVFAQGQDSNYSPILTIEVHRNEAITSILPLGSRGDQSHNYVLSTCRDGKYRIHEIVTIDSQANAVLLHEALPPFVSSIEGAWLSDNGDSAKDLILCGFRSHNFIVWNETQRHEVATVDCGGSSRSYAWTPRASHPDGFRFVFTKAGQMQVFSQTANPCRALKVGGHGREIKAVSVSGRYIATAAEDTVVRIWEYDSNDRTRLHCVAALEKHAAGIQALKWYKNEYLFSSAGNEEFFVWKINQLESDDFTGLAVVCEAVFPDRTEVGDARITDFDVDILHGEFRISMALSNSTWQTYAYTCKAGFRLLGRSSYTGACLTQIRHLGRTHILTAATDGHIAIYPSTEQAPEADGQTPAKTEILPVVAKLHQNTIKSLDVRQVAPANGNTLEYIVVAGGDDNALGLMHVSFSSQDTSAIAIKGKYIIRSAHAAAITGIAIARLENDSRAVVVVTSSNDQRVKVWRLVGWQQPSGQLRAQLLDERYSSVADAGDLDVFEDVDTSGHADGRGACKKMKIIVVGVGVEIWELDV